MFYERYMLYTFEYGDLVMIFIKSVNKSSWLNNRVQLVCDKININTSQIL